MLKLVFLISFIVLLPKSSLNDYIGSSERHPETDEYPWTALFEYGHSFNSECGGSLINERYVVTAAHCVKIIEKFFIPRVLLGAWDRRRFDECTRNEHNEIICTLPHVPVYVKSIIVHPKYELKEITVNNETVLVKLINDIALLRLEQPVNFTKFVSPISLPVEPELSSASFEGVELDYVGWGRTERKDLSPVKMKATVKGVNVAECKNAYSVEFDDSAICAGGFKGVNSCRGDSGGPLVGIHKTNGNSFHYYLAGIVSFGKTNCTLEGYPGVYTRVSQYIDWIKENLKP